MEMISTAYCQDKGNSLKTRKRMKLQYYFRVKTLPSQDKCSVKSQKSVECVWMISTECVLTFRKYSVNHKITSSYVVFFLISNTYPSGADVFMSVCRSLFSQMSFSEATRSERVDSNALQQNQFPLA